jgi:hypothetical protein
MPNFEGGFSNLFSHSCNGTPQNKGSVCKEVPILMGRELPIHGKFLLTFRVPSKETGLTRSGSTEE